MKDKQQQWHVLKTDVDHYRDIVSGLKKFEVRYDDRDYQVGDILVLREHNRKPALFPSDHAEGYTGRTTIVRVTSIVNVADVAQDERGKKALIDNQIVCMGIEPWQGMDVIGGLITVSGCQVIGGDFVGSQKADPGF